MDFSKIQDMDMQVLSLFNGSDNIMLDQMVQILTSGLTWIPLYVMLFFVVMRNNETMGQIALVVGSAIFCVLFADGLVDGIIKQLAERWRPSNDPTFKYMVQVVDDIRLKGYSFCSAHAANTMSLAVFFSLLIRSKMLTITLVIWSLINCWTRLYLGVHYPSDILCGMIIGIIVGILVYLLYYKIYLRISPKINYISNQYTSTGYDHDDIDKAMVILMLTLVYVVTRSVVMAGLV
ncbi:phosphatase PAP2 family protein [Segatella copri]|jgi:PAP2 family protein|uniref:phosphatase PAP2 family protein n=1 Tax=Segatella copri TaxID=165179 RepID=UPI001C38C1B4|nr:phosphatase PAP2 family protein [Segatella copri]MBV3400214.1 phosphatase PAP2 family protein [Segatella copri]MBW0049067.1 phosphatase PAP2 family protein [Segatella copri]